MRIPVLANPLTAWDRAPPRWQSCGAGWEAVLPTGTGVTHGGQQGAGSVPSQLPSDGSCSNRCGCGQIASRASSGVEAL